MHAGAHRAALLKEGTGTLAANTGKAIQRDYIKATVGSEQVRAETDASPKRVIRMFGPSGNPGRATSSPSSATCSATPG